MKKTFAEALQDMIDAYLEEHPSTLSVDVVLYTLEQQCRLLRATNNKSTTTEGSEKA